jgi:excinuclease ABC subunit C
LKITENIQQILNNIPSNPGVYRYYDKNGELLYIGKAKNLKKRVKSYFQKKDHNSRKTEILVRKITDIKFIIVETEQDALLLENSLIKKHQPKYNIQLKDDKTYPWIVIKKEQFPRVFYTRNFIRDGSEYFGPYPSGKMVSTILKLVNGLYKLRNCNLNLSKENIEGAKFRVCLEYQMGNCNAPCVMFQSEEEYNEDITQIRNILKGDVHSVIRILKEEEKKAVEKLAFEDAQLISEQLEELERYKSRSTVVNPKLHNIDVFSLLVRDEMRIVNFMKVSNGSIVQVHNAEIKQKLDETNQELLEFAIQDIRDRYNSTSKHLLVSQKVDIPELKITIPKIGDKKKLMELSERNAKYFYLEKIKRSGDVLEKKGQNRVLIQIKKDLRLSELPTHIECFDNSNFQGTNAVAACVVFKNGKPSKKDYRHFNIKTVVGPDDFASMEEVVYRRYKRLLDEKQSLPQLIIIDGGKGQLGSALKSLDKLDLRGKIAIVGIAKKLEEIFVPGDSIPIYIDKKSESLKVIQHLRNEAHRFGITHHRNKRSKNTFVSELSEIKGIGQKTQDALLQYFKSVKRIKEAEKSELEKVIGLAKSQIVWEYFNQ